MSEPPPTHAHGYRRYNNLVPQLLVSSSIELRYEFRDVTCESFPKSRHATCVFFKQPIH